jgi:effector-binding domain-containing protein
MKILKVFGIILAVLLVFIIILVIAMPTTYHVERSITINAPRNIVYDQVSYFENFIKWSPWSKLDPDMSYEINGQDGSEGTVYSWSGNDSVGVGRLTNVSVTSDRIEQKLDFSSPWESHDITYYEFEDTAEGVKVIWGMDGHMKRPLNLMGLFMNMDNMIGTSYEDGLSELKTLVNEYMIQHTKRGYLINEIEMKPRNFIIKREEIKFEDMQSFYATHFPAIMLMIQMLDLPLAGAPSGLYYNLDMENNLADMAAGIPVEGEADIEGYEMVRIESKALKIKYYGSYAGIREAHFAMDEYMQENGLALNEVIIEEYVTDPSTEPDTSKWLTNLYYMVQ